MPREEIKDLKLEEWKFGPARKGGLDKGTDAREETKLHKRYMRTSQEAVEGNYRQGQD